MIWCDLDNTLIWTWEPLITSPLLSAAFGLPMDTKPPRGPGRRRLKRIEIPELGIAYACARKSARRFLEELRRWDRVKLLTGSLRCYAATMNATFQLGFDAADIVAREDLDSDRPEPFDRRAVLIDNQSQFLSDDRHYAMRARKLRLLGATSASVIEVPCFGGELEDPFEASWCDYAWQARTKLQEAGT